MTPPTPPPLRDRAFPIVIAALAAGCASPPAPSPRPPVDASAAATTGASAGASVDVAAPLPNASAPTPSATPTADPPRAARRPTATSAPSDFVEDGRFDEWRLQDPLREADGVSLYLSTSAAGLVLAVKSAAPKAIATTGACSITMTLATAPPTLPSLGVDELVFFQSLERDDSCSLTPTLGSVTVDQCNAWRKAQVERRAKITAASTRAVTVPCHAGSDGIEAVVPLRELPPIATRQLDALDLAITAPVVIDASVDLAEPVAPKPGSLLAFALRDPATNPQGTAFTWRVAEPDGLTYYFNPTAGELPSAKSPDTLVVDLARRTKLAEQNGVKIERVDRAEPPWAFADRSLIVVSKGGVVTGTTRLGREKLAVLRASDHMDLVFAFAGNAQPTSMQAYSVGSAWATRVDASGAVPTEPWWRVSAEPPSTPTATARFDVATISADGKQIMLGGARSDGSGRFEYRYSYDDVSAAFVERAAP